MSDHSFNIFIAKNYGVNEAIFINNMIFWTRTNASNETHYHEGRYWSFGTPEFFSKYFPYFKPRLLKDIINSCVKQGLLLKGNFNKKGYDKTNWYSLSDGALIELNLTKTCLEPAKTLIGRNPSNGSDVIRPMDQTDYVQPIPDTKPDTKPLNKNTTTTRSSSLTEFENKALSFKLQTDNRTESEFLENVYHHIENNSDNGKSEYQRQQMIIKLLRNLNKANHQFQSTGFVSQEMKIIIDNDRKMKEKLCAYNEFVAIIKNDIKLGLKPEDSYIPSFKEWDLNRS